jgi:hypothetical protein
MKLPHIHYRSSRIHKPKILLLSWVGYLLFYVLTEKWITSEMCYPVHHWVDDAIPFCEWFFVPYVFWYLLLVFTVVYFLLYDIELFCKFQVYVLVVQLIAFSVYILFPTRQDLRPETFPRNNLLTSLVALLYQLDDNTGVCPSLHVAFSIAMASSWKKSNASYLWRACVLVIAVLICLSTMFVKQHSFWDFLAALPICFLAEFIAFRTKIYAVFSKSQTD